MTIALTYIDPRQTWICCVLQSGDVLGTGSDAVIGPAVIYFPQDGSNINFQQAVAQGLMATVVDPTRPPPPTRRT